MGDFLHVTSFIDGVLFVQKHDYRYTLNGLRGYTMADKKRHRNKKANDEEKRQRERDIAEELGRTGESEPPIEAAELAYFEKELETLEFPTTGEEIIATVGDHEVESPDETHAVAELVPDTAQEEFESPTAVRTQIQRPTVAAAMKRILEAGGALPNAGVDESQRNAYKKTFQELRDMDADDDDESIKAIADWIVDEIARKGKLPGSRAVRRQAAKLCRENGYRIRNDEWLGI